MKRLFSLAMLFCSLTLCAVVRAETWRLTDNAYSDSLPKITFDNSGRAWVVWLSNANGSYNVYDRYFTSSSWSTVDQLTNDNVNKYRCLIANNPKTGELIAAWDSVGYIYLSKFLSSWSAPEAVNPSGPELNDSYGYDGNFALFCSDSGFIHIAWSAYAYSTGFQNGVLKSNDGVSWDTVEIVLNVNAIYSDVFFVQDLVSTAQQQPTILFTHDWSSIMGNEGSEIGIVAWSENMGWYWGQPIGNWFNIEKPTIGVCTIENDNLLVCYQDHFDSGSIKCHRVRRDTLLLDTIFTIVNQPVFQTGSLLKHGRPTVAWSDSHSIFLNAYYDTIWSHPPVRISDTSLHNCINPDIAAENDSTVWVCYQNDGDIYVTRTSVPLGVSEKPPAQIPNRRSKISFKSWPNPASNAVHFACTLPNILNSSVSVYDIAGRLVRTLDISGDQVAWNCADNAGYKVSSGVYFARLKSGGQEIIQRISIIK
jgi:hypothetical protein